MGGRQRADFRRTLTRMPAAEALQTLPAPPRGTISTPHLHGAWRPLHRRLPHAWGVGRRRLHTPHLSPSLHARRAYRYPAPPPVWCFTTTSWHHGVHVVDWPTWRGVGITTALYDCLLLNSTVRTNRADLSCDYDLVQYTISMVVMKQRWASRGIPALPHHAARSHLSLCSSRAAPTLPLLCLACITTTRTAPQALLASLLWASSLPLSIVPAATPPHHAASTREQISHTRGGCGGGRRCAGMG